MISEHLCYHYCYNHSVFTDIGARFWLIVPFCSTFCNAEHESIFAAAAPTTTTTTTATQPNMYNMSTRKTTLT